MEFPRGARFTPPKRTRSCEIRATLVRSVISVKIRASASVPAYFNAGVASLRVAAPALPYLRDGCRSRPEHPREIAATHYVPRRALRTLHRWHGCRCGWHQHEHGERGDVLSFAPRSISKWRAGRYSGVSLPLRRAFSLASKR